MSADADQTRVAIVTGANRGIGKEIARQLAAAGFAVVVTARVEQRAVEAAEELRAAGAVVSRALDITEAATIARLRDSVLGEFGRVDVLINNAAIMDDDDSDALHVDTGVVRRTLETNVIGAWSMSRTFIPPMLERNYGRIVNISSGCGSFSDGMCDGQAAYSLSKASLNALTVLLAEQTKSHNVLVNSACPGWVQTDMGGPSAPRSVTQGADTPVWLATAPDDGPRGGFFRDRKPLVW